MTSAHATMSKFYDVIIAGAGPVGLFLACELALAGTSVLVLERDVNPESEWKTDPLGRRGFNTVSAEAFYRRGLLGKLSDLSERPFSVVKAPGFQYAGPFAAIMLDANKLDLNRWKYRLPGPSLVPMPTTKASVETALIERAENLGVTILRGSGVTKIAAQDSHSITVEAGSENQSFRGRWLVGCDGGRSLIRKAASFSFVGTEARFTGYVFKCTLSEPNPLTPGFNFTKSGMYIFRPPGMLYLVDFDDASFDRTKEITMEHLQAVLERVTGRDDVRIESVKLASSFTDRSKQTTTYRMGRVLLAGDAAHIHSPLGAQGLNVGIGDAMNLGWKLAAVVRWEVEAEAAVAATATEGKELGLDLDSSFLDTYTSERHPIAAWVLDWTRAQVATMVPDAIGAATRALISDLIATVDGTNLFIDRVWGLSQRYENLNGGGAKDAHPLVGCSAPDFEFVDGERLGKKMEGGRGWMVDFEPDGERLKGLVERFEGKVDYLGIGAVDKRGLKALLVRPDGIVAWVSEEGEKIDGEEVERVLGRWFGD